MLGHLERCPMLVFLKRGAGLRAKDAKATILPRRTNQAFQDWLSPLLKIEVTFRNDCPFDVRGFWHATGDEAWGTVVADRIKPGAGVRQTTFPTHTFSFAPATAYSKPLDLKDVRKGKHAVPDGVRILTHVVSSEEGVVVSLKPPDTPLDGHVSCKHKAVCKNTIWRGRCPRTCPMPPAGAPRPGPKVRYTQEDLFQRSEL